MLFKWVRGKTNISYFCIMQNELIIRRAVEADSPLLAKIIRGAFEEHGAPKTGTVYSDPTTDDLFSSFNRKDAALLVAESGHSILGCCGVYPTEGLPERYAELVKFYLSPEARGKGTGRALMEESITQAKNLGYSHLYIESLPQFSRAVSMYEKLGFETLPSPLGNSGHTSCTIWMLKQL